MEGMSLYACLAEINSTLSALAHIDSGAKLKEQTTATRIGKKNYPLAHSALSAVQRRAMSKLSPHFANQ